MSRSLRPQTHSHGLTRAEDEMIMRRGFRADVLRVHGLLLAMHNVVVDAILDIREGLSVPYRRWSLVSFSVKSSSGALSQQSWR